MWGLKGEGGREEEMDARDHDASVGSDVGGTVISISGVIGNDVLENEDTL